MDDGSRIPIEVPGQCEAERGEEVVITTILPEDIFEEAVLGIRTSKHDMTISVDGVVRKTYSTVDSRVLGKTSVSVYTFVPLSVSDSGKELIIRFSTDSSYAGVMRDVYYGDMFGIWYDLLEKNAVQLINGFFIFILAIVTIVGSNILEMRSGKRVYLEYLGWGVFLMAGWLMFQSPLRQLFFRNISLAGDIAHFCLLLLALPICIYVNNVQKYRYYKFYMPVSFAVIINFIVCTILMSLNIMEYAQLQYINYVIYGITMTGLVVTNILDWKNGCLKDYKRIAYGYTGLVVASIIQIIMSFRKDVVLNGNFLCVGVIFMLFMATIQSIHEYIRREREDAELKQEVDQKNIKVEKLTYQALITLAQTIDAKDKYTKGHSIRVAEYSRMIAAKWGMNEQQQMEIYFMGLLHDIGKIGIKDDIINKPGRLTDEEFALIKSHSTIGFDILKNMTEVANIEYGARWHHERYDGNGYPDGLKGEDIPEYARIIAIADAYDAMTSNRSYRNAMPQEKVREEIVAGKGKQFDPAFAEIMLGIIDSDASYDMRQKD